MSYRLHITKSAERDMDDAADYIEFSLMNPIAADHLFDLIEEKLSPLSSNPKMYPVVDEPVFRVWGIRFVVVNNYLAFYTIDESEKIVHIVRFLYGKRNWTHILKTEGINQTE